MVNPLLASAAASSKLVTWNSATATIENQSGVKQLAKRVRGRRTEEAISAAATKAIRACITNSFLARGPMTSEEAVFAQELEARTLTILDRQPKITARTVNAAIATTITETISAQLSELAVLTKNKLDLTGYLRASSRAAQASLDLYALVNTREDGTMNLFRSKIVRLHNLQAALQTLTTDVNDELERDRSLALQINQASSYADLERSHLAQKDQDYQELNRRFNTWDQENVTLARYTVVKAQEVVNELDQVANDRISLDEMSDLAALVLEREGYDPGSTPRAQVTNYINSIKARINNKVAVLVNSLSLDDLTTDAPIRSFAARQLPSYAAATSLPNYQAPPAYSPLASDDS